MLRSVLSVTCRVGDMLKYCPSHTFLSHADRALFLTLLYSLFRDLKRAIGLRPPSLFSSSLAARSVRTVPNEPTFSHCHMLVDSVPKPLSDIADNCLGLLPSTTQVLRLKADEASRMSAAETSWVLVASMVSTSGGPPGLPAQCQNLVQSLICSLRRAEGWWVAFSASS